MKTLPLYIFSVLIACLVFSCEKEKPQEVLIYEKGDQEFGWATGLKSGLKWEASSYWQPHWDDSIHWGITFETFSSYGARRESYSLNEIPFSEGTFSIKGTYSDLGDEYVGGIYGRFADDGDAVIGALNVNDDKNGYITITEIDTSTQTIKGFFDIYFSSEDGSLRIEVTQGEFEARPYQ